MTEWFTRETFDAWVAIMMAAPHLTVLMLASVGIAVFFWQGHRYAGVRERIAARDETIARLKADLAAVPTLQVPAPAVIMVAKEEEQTLYQPDGTPDTKLVRVFEYVGKASYWSEQNNPMGADVLREIRDKLQLRQLSAWGRKEADAAIERIPWMQWRHLKLHPGKGAIAPDDTVEWHDIQFDIGHVSNVWAPRRV